MSIRSPYLASESTFREYACHALDGVMQDRHEFDAFYAALPDEAAKNEFLRISSRYLFLVKCGDWCVRHDESIPVVDYLTNSFKLVALFALIESTARERYQDFFQWVLQRHRESLPIKNRSELEALYESYKLSFGSTRRCVAFFDRIGAERRSSLCRSIQIDGQPMKSVEDVARFLYQLRNKFVHECDLVLLLGGSTALEMKGKKRLEVQLDMSSVMMAFEEGLLEHFRWRGETPAPNGADGVVRR